MALSYVAQAARGLGQPMVPQTRGRQGDTITERFMMRWRGEPDPKHVKAVDAYWTSAAEHGMNASTFTARVVASTGADVAASLSAAVGAMSGPLHGGAPSRVLHMIEEVERRGDAAAYVKELLDDGERLMGFGHRVYRAEDPRARVLRRTARELGAPRYEVAEALEKAALDELRTRRPDRVLETNVEFWAAIMLDFAQVPPHMFTSMFTCARTAGWSAHILEQKRTGRLIRPSALLHRARRPATAAEVAGWDGAWYAEVTVGADGRRSASTPPTSTARSSCPTLTHPRRPAARATAASAPARARSGSRRSTRWPRPGRRTWARRTGRRRSERVVGRVRDGLAELFSLPDGYEVVLGNGGATAFWDVAAFGLIRRSAASTWRSASSRPSSPPRSSGAPFLDEPDRDHVRARHAPGRRGRGRRRRLRLAAQRDVDRRDGCRSTGSPAPTTTRSSLIDATSGAGGLPVDVARDRRLLLRAAEVLRRRRRPLARAAVAARRSSGSSRSRPSGRWIPAFLDLPIAIDNSRARPDLQHAGAGDAVPAAPSRSTGSTASAGSAGAVARTADSSDALYALGREAADYATPFVADPATARWSSGRSTSTRRRRRRRSPRCCAPTASSTSSRTASSAATSCGSRCSRPSTPTTSRR